MQKILFGHLRGVAAGGLVRKRQIERRRRAEKSHVRLLVRKACSIFDPGGQKSQVRRLVRNRRFERRRRAEKSHGRLLVKNGVQIETTLRKISQTRRAACEIFNNGGADRAVQ